MRSSCVARSPFIMIAPCASCRRNSPLLIAISGFSADIGRPGRKPFRYSMTVNFGFLCCSFGAAQVLKSKTVLRHF